ncbi:transcriptional regulator [Saccharothrix isguenensis]
MAHTVKLRTDTFNKAMRLAGSQSDYAMAKAMGINRSTIARVTSGELRPGPVFIASALTALAPMQFHDLFEIVPTTTAQPSRDGD